jgi:8-oxo-dGTP diphosphatase
MSQTEKVPVGVGVIIVRRGKILVGRRTGKNGKHTWSMPGGHLDIGETPEQTAIREVFEETGLGIASVKFLAYTNDIFPEQHKHYLTLWMISACDEGEPHVTASHEMDSFAWVEADDVPLPHFLPYDNLLASPYAAALRKVLAQSAAR